MTLFDLVLSLEPNFSINQSSDLKFLIFVNMMASRFL